MDAEKKKKQRLEPGLFDIVIYGRNHKPTVLFKYIDGCKYEISVLTDYYRISEDNNNIYSVDPDNGPYIAKDTVLYDDRFDEALGKWVSYNNKKLKVTNLYYISDKTAIIAETVSI